MPIDSNWVTVIAVSVGSVATSYITAKREERRIELARLQHDWDVQDRAAKNQNVLTAIAENTEVTKKVVSPVVDTAKIIESLVNSETSIPNSDIGKVLAQMKKDLDNLEKYAHDSVHKINNLIQSTYARDILETLKNEGNGKT